ncbi:hypothetical protein Q4504_02770 [Mesomycoplasma ovipneumoniae]|uniref:hypothetical protein n=2 Tax=Mesomycoplasma ovipneumoniae TaxID=29562 RepID=UPI0026E23162|nr:hypothetical protein [Mesomycoplasma ovipneumoniae]MDO6856394.1 hypothetical protein [Mesomycoplasma ovipneumoniae]MDO6857382.1 hypothetical protein [Mesomycoplasma ovipneumoniae]
MTNLTNLIKEKKLNDKNSRKFWILFVLSIIKTMFFLSLVVLHSSSYEHTPRLSYRLSPRLSSHRESNIDLDSLIGKVLMTILLIVIFLFFISLFFRISLAWNLRDDEILKQSVINLKQFSNAFLLFPLTVSILLINNSFSPKNTIANHWTTRQLITKWKIINRFVLLTLFFATILAFISAYALSSSGIRTIDNNFITNFADVLRPIFVFALWFAWILFFSLVSYLFKIYKSIDKTEEANQTYTILDFFVSFLRRHSRLFYKNIKSLRFDWDISLIEKELKTKEEIITEESKIKTSLEFYKFSIIKNIFHFIFIILFMIAAIVLLVVPTDQLIGQKASIGVLLGLFSIAFSFYFFYIVPHYIANFSSLTKNGFYIILYILDIFVPIVSIYNLIKYKQNKTILV